MVTAIYGRSRRDASDRQAQRQALERWSQNQTAPVRWYEDEVQDGADHCPQFQRLLADVRAGQVTAVCVWRLECLGEVRSTALALIGLVDELLARDITLVSLCERLHLRPQPKRFNAS
jgi:DNA invertase Pin-like site-specific DNA recombinase